MSGDSGKEKPDMNIHQPDEAQHMPPVPASSQGAEVVKQIIEQILVNERRRARMEFVRLSVFFLLFLVVILGAGFWFARQLLAQLREERQLTEQTWRMMAAGGGDKAVVALEAEDDVNTPPPLQREEVDRLEQNINTVSDLLKSKPRDSSTAIQDMIQQQQNAIQALNARLNEVQGKPAGAPAAPGAAATTDFISAPVADDVKLRMPIPAL